MHPWKGSANERGSENPNSRDTYIVEVKDLDEITTKEEIYQALTKQLERFREYYVKTSAIKSLRKAYLGTQIVTVSLPADVAERL